MFSFSRKKSPFGLHHLEDRRPRNPCCHGVSRNDGEQRRGAKAMAVRQEHGWREGLSVTRMREGRKSRVASGGIVRRRTLEFLGHVSLRLKGD
jgi:hypothetical protein